MKIENIKNETFKKNSIDSEKNRLISSIYLLSNNLNKKNRLVWSFYRDREKINVNNIIQKYGRNTLIINYSIETNI